MKSITLKEDNIIAKESPKAYTSSSQVGNLFIFNILGGELKIGVP